MLRATLEKFQLNIMKFTSRFYEIFYTLQRYLNERLTPTSLGYEAFACETS